MGHVDNPKAKKLTLLDRRKLFQEQCRIQPCSSYDNGKGCVVCVHEGLIRKKLSGGQ